jgi:hypothetical protein
MKFLAKFLPFALLAVFAAVAQAQLKPTSTPDAGTPPAHAFHDSRSGVTLQIPAGWELTRKDGEVSTFRLDARSSTKSTQFRAVANITFNPFPRSTFSGAYFYTSFTPHLSDAECTRQASARNSHPVTTTPIAGIPFSHGYDEHGGVCTESRDEVYTATRRGSCYRFDLVINNFCGGDVSGVREMTPKELDSIRKRLEAILATVQFDK